MISKDHTTWNACPPGTLVGISRRARRRRLLKLAIRTTVAVTAVAMLSFTAWFGHLYWGQREYQYYGMTCADVRELLPAYQSGRLDARRSDVLVRHVIRCSNCAELRPQLRSEDQIVAVVSPRNEPCQCCVHRSIAAMHRAGDTFGAAANRWPGGGGTCFIIPSAVVVGTCATVKFAENPSLAHR